MSRVVFDISMSLDGFVNASNRRPEEPMGDGGQRLHEWAFGGEERNREFFERSISSTKFPMALSTRTRSSWKSTGQRGSYGATRMGSSAPPAIGGACIPESGGIRSRNGGRAQVRSCLGLLVSTPTLRGGDLQGSREQTGNALPLRVLRSGTPNAVFIGHDLPVNPTREEAKERHGRRARYGLASSIDGATRRHVEEPVEQPGRQHADDQGQPVEIGPSTIRSRPPPDQCHDHRNRRNG